MRGHSFTNKPINQKNTSRIETKDILVTNYFLKKCPENEKSIYMAINFRDIFLNMCVQMYCCVENCLDNNPWNMGNSKEQQEIHDLQNTWIGMC